MCKARDDGERQINHKNYERNYVVSTKFLNFEGIKHIFNEPSRSLGFLPCIEGQFVLDIYNYPKILK